MMVILGKPGNGKLTPFRFFLVLINSIILSFSSFMFFHLIHINNSLKKLQHLNHELSINNIDNSIKFLSYIIHNLTFINYLYIVIMTCVFIIIELRSTIWAGEDDRLII